MGDLFAPRPSRTGSHVAALKEHVRRALELHDDVTVMISELRCSEPGCPPVETVIAIMNAGNNRQFKIHKPLADVTEADIAELVRTLGSRPPAL